jgi:hypothetical protein
VRTSNKARDHLKAVISWAWEQDLIESLPRFPKPKPQRDVAGRHYLTKTEINALYFATHQMKRPKGWQQPLSIGSYWRAALIVFLTTDSIQGRYGSQRPSTSRFSGGMCTGPGTPQIALSRAVSLGMALLSARKDEQGVLPANEPCRPRPQQELHAGKSKSGCSDFSWRQCTPECLISAAL